MILIIGAGLAGLACATRLEQVGADWLLLEASDCPGGRVATHVTPDGYRLDHGFQVLLDSYPTARELLDFEALNPCYFKSGALLAGNQGVGEILNPLVHPGGILKTLADQSIPWSQKVSLALYGAEILLQDGGGFGISALEDLRRHGLEGAVLERFLRPFFAGVFLDNDLGTDASVLRSDIRNFALGRALLPAEGMGEIPRQMASRLPSERQRYGSRVESLVRQGVRVVAVVLESGEKIGCDALVIATEEPATRRLLGMGEGRTWQSVSTFYFTGEKPLYEGGYLVLPAGRDRLVRHFCDLTNVAPSYAPAGRRLLTATVLSVGEGDPVPGAINEITAIFPAFSEWKFLERLDIPWALPSQAPGFTNTFAERRQGANCWLAGDQVACASIDSALASGLRAADELLPTIS
jgi:phytoene dehydrogenase-like protein